MYLIDTNIFLEFLLGQEKADECLDLIESLVTKNIPIFISRFEIYTIEIIMVLNKKHQYLLRFLESLLSYGNVKIIDTNLTEDQEIIRITEKFNLDFDDALHYYICTAYNLKIISYDKHFDKTSIKRLEPSDLRL